MAEYLEQLRQDTFTATGNGVIQSVVNKPIKSFAIQIKGTGAAATAWSVVIEGSLDGTNFTTIMTHANTVETDGEAKWTGASLYPVLHFRSRCVSITLGSATNIVANVLAYE